MDVRSFIETLLTFGLEYFKVYPGLYRGVVSRVDDPEERGRIQAHVPGVGQRQAPDIWIKPSISGAGASRGMFWPPEVGDTVFVSFAQGNPGRPELYLGGWFGYPKQASDVPGEFGYAGGVPVRRGFITRMGHGVVFSDEPDNEYVRIFWHKPESGDEALNTSSETASRDAGNFAFLEFTKEGSVQLSNKNGSFVFMDAEGSAVSMVSEHGHALTFTEDGVTIVDSDGNLVSLDKGKLNIVVDGNANITAKSVNLASAGVALGSPAPNSVPIGELLLTYLATHTHPTGVGPSGPPIVPPTPALLSRSVKLKP